MVKNLSNSYTSWVASALYISAFSLVSFGGVSGQTVRLVSDPGEEEVTFTRDVMPILQENCTGCHREGSIAPIHLETYEQARRYSRRIRDKVVTREMPPFHLDTDVGIQEIKGDCRLSEDEINVLMMAIVCEPRKDSFRHVKLRQKMLRNMCVRRFVS